MQMCTQFERIFLKCIVIILLALYKPLQTAKSNEKFSKQKENKKSFSTQSRIKIAGLNRVHSLSLNFGKIMLAAKDNMISPDNVI